MKNNFRFRQSIRNSYIRKYFSVDDRDSVKLRNIKFGGIHLKIVIDRDMLLVELYDMRSILTEAALQNDEAKAAKRS